MESNPSLFEYRLDLVIYSLLTNRCGESDSGWLSEAGHKRRASEPSLLLRAACSGSLAPVGGKCPRPQAECRCASCQPTPFTGAPSQQPASTTSCVTEGTSRRFQPQPMSYPRGSQVECRWAVSKEACSSSGFMNKMNVAGLVCPAFFIQHNVFKVHPRCSRCQYFIPFYG